MASDVRLCEACGQPLEKKVRPNGRREAPSDFARRRTCGHACLGPVQAAEAAAVYAERVAGLLGRRFGLWRVVGSGESFDVVACVCECKVRRDVRIWNLEAGGSSGCHSCTSLARDPSRLFRKHGQHRTRLYRIWQGMKQRCENPKSEVFASYGGRGIDVCAEWRLDFKAFYEWSMSHGYQDGLQVDRADNGRGYSPENCRWVTPTENNRNKRTTRTVHAFGEAKSAAAWAEDPRFRATYRTFLQRLNRGWSPESAILAPVRPGRPQ